MGLMYPFQDNIICKFEETIFTVEEEPNKIFVPSDNQIVGYA